MSLTINREIVLHTVFYTKSSINISSTSSKGYQSEVHVWRCFVLRFITCIDLVFQFFFLLFVCRRKFLLNLLGLSFVNVNIKKQNSFINSIFRNKFLKFNIPLNSSLKTILRHLSQSHAMIYISGHLEVFYKKLFLKVLQNSQENGCAGASFFRNFNKTEAPAQVVSCEICKIGST